MITFQYPSEPMAQAHGLPRKDESHVSERTASDTNTPIFLKDQSKRSQKHPYSKRVDHLVRNVLGDFIICFDPVNLKKDCGELKFFTVNSPVSK